MKAWIDEYSDWIQEIDPSSLKKTFEELLIKAGFGIISFTEHYFEPQGYTGLWLISESHFAVHTFPEENKTYIQLSSCNREMYYRFIELMKIYKKTS
ncbi:MAG: S-adenosylmethionine decarboxylase [Cyclobacteriaceae bacterium]|nr:S-adenosylmethionine decarboxylase [Cyclobacteriaceae bacterium]